MNLRHVTNNCDQVFFITCRLLFIASKKKKYFYVIFIHKNCFELFLYAHFLFREFWTWNWRLPFAVNVTFALSYILIQIITWAQPNCLVSQGIRLQLGTAFWINLYEQADFIR